MPKTSFGLGLCAWAWASLSKKSVKTMASYGSICHHRWSMQAAWTKKVCVNNDQLNLRTPPRVAHASHATWTEKACVTNGKLCLVRGKIGVDYTLCWLPPCALDMFKITIFSGIPCVFWCPERQFLFSAQNRSSESYSFLYSGV